MTTVLMPVPKQQYFNSTNQRFLAGGKLYTYAAGTTTPKATYTDSAGLIPQTNPIILNARGEPDSPIYWDGAYKVVLKDAADSTIYTVDNYKSDPFGVVAFIASIAASAGSSLIGFIQAGVGAVARTLQDKARERVSVFDFMTSAQIADARSGSPVLDHTTAIQAALDTLPTVLDFNQDGTFRVGVLQIKGPCEIRGNGCGLLGSGLGIFNATVSMPYLSIHGFKNVAWVAGDSVGTTGRQFFWNGDNAAGSTAFGATTAYPIVDLRIYDNNPGASKIECFGLTTVSRVYNNNWTHGSGVHVAPAYLYAERGTTDDNAGPVYIEGNHFDVYPPDGSGKSIIKVTGGVTDAQIHNNYVKNNNQSCLAQVDIFTGANKMRFIGNTLIDTQLVRKQVKGSLAAAPTLYQLDTISGNMFDIRSGALTNTHVYYIGALSTISGNQFRTRNSTAVGYCIQLDPSDVDIGFDTNGPVGVIITSNIFDMRSSFTGNAAVKVGTPTIGSSGARYLIDGLNLLLGGTYMLQGGAQIYSSVVGNVWGSSSGASGVSINGSNGSNLMVGNVADSSAPVFAGGTRGNLVNLSIPTLAASATPDVSAGDMFFTNTATITNFTGGYIGKKITLFTGGTTTVQHGTNIQLSGDVDVVFDTFVDSLTLVQTTATRWVEVGRSAK